MGPKLLETIAKYYDNTYENMGAHNSFAWLGARWAQASTAPNRLYKHFTTEGGIRVPLIVRYPPFLSDRYPAGSICHAFATCMDVMPTLLSLAGITHPNAHPQHPRDKAKFHDRQVYSMRGKSWIPLLVEGKTAVPSKETVGKKDMAGETMAKDAEAIHGNDDPPVGWEMQGCASLRHGPWKIVRQNKNNWGTGTWELFNLTEDQGETKDLAKELPEKLQEMMGYYHRYEMETGATQILEPLHRGMEGKPLVTRLGGDPRKDQKAWLDLEAGQTLAEGRASA